MPEIGQIGQTKFYMPDFWILAYKYATWQTAHKNRGRAADPSRALLRMGQTNLDSIDPVFSIKNCYLKH